MTARESLQPKIGTLASLALLACVSGCGAPQDQPGETQHDKLNVVLIVIDSLRADALSGNGYERETSPRMDAYARENVRFTQALTVAASTPPAMAAIMNGRYPFYAQGVTWNGFEAYGMKRFYQDVDEWGLPRDPDSLAEILDDAGYRTAGIVTNGYVTRDTNFDQGFDTFDELLTSPATPYGPADTVTKTAIQRLGEIRDEPFFLYLHYMDVHYPYLPPEEFQRRFDFERVAGKGDADIQPLWLQETGLDSPENQHIAEHARGLYDSEIAFADYWIGHLLDWIAREGLDENTMVIITSDHGEEFLEHGNTIHKAKLYQELVHVPLILSIPGVEATEIESPVRNFDIMPTILDYLGISPVPKPLDAKSLRPLIEGSEPASERDVFGNFPTLASRAVPDHRQMLRTDRYKLILNLDDPTQSELYDLKDDPGELENVFEELSDERQELIYRLDDIAGPLREETAANAENIIRITEATKERARPGWDKKVQEALARMSPEEREAAINKALATQAHAAEGLGPDAQTIEQLKALGYVD